MLKRILSAALLIPLVLACVAYLPPRLFTAMLALIGILCLYEYFTLLKGIGIPGSPWFAYPAFCFLMAAFLEGWLPQSAALAAVLIAAFLVSMWHERPLRDRAFSLMGNVLGVFYFALFLYPAAAARYDFGAEKGLQWFVLLLAVIWAGDTAALLAGRKLGRTLFAPQISPKKTNEGALAGLLAGVAVALLLQLFAFTELPRIHVLFASILLGMFGQLGDLAESMLKRAAQVKDSSQLIPGHGGVLDRIDSLLFAFPVLYFYMLRLYGQ